MKLTVELRDSRHRNTDSTLVFVQLLADQYLLYLQTVSCFLYLQQQDPQGMHSYLEWQFHKLHKIMEEVMEWIDFREHGHLNHTSGFLRLARLMKTPTSDEEIAVMSGELLYQHVCLIEWLEGHLQSIPDKTNSTYSFLASIKEEHVFMAWLMRVFLS